MGDRETASAVLNAFCNDTPKKIKKLKTALQTGDKEICERLGHSIKGSARNINADTLSEIGNAFETAGRENTLDSIGKRLSELESTMERTVTEIRNFLDD